MAVDVTELVAVVFDTPDGAEKALKDLKRAEKEKVIGIINAAILKKDEKGKISYHETAETKDLRNKSLIGGGTGALLGLLGGPGGWLITTVVGAAIGGMISAFTDKGIPNEDLKDLANTLNTNTSTIVALVEHKWVNDLIDAFADYTAEVVKYELSEEISASLNQAE